MLAHSQTISVFSLTNITYIKNRVKMSMTVEDCTVVRPGFPRPFPDTPSNVVEQLKLNGKVAVVTGAADGIGLAVAEGYAEAGADVVFWYHTNEAAVQKAEEVAKLHGVKTKAYRVDGKLCSGHIRTHPLLLLTPRGLVNKRS